MTIIRELLLTLDEVDELHRRAHAAGLADGTCALRLQRDDNLILWVDPFPHAWDIPTYRLTPNGRVFDEDGA